jgi:hypothetical protein
MSTDRINTMVRWPVAVKRGIREYGLLVHATETAATVALVLIGLEEEYRRLGIRKNPAVTAVDLLLVLGESWDGDLSEEELVAFATARAALGRIAELRSRDPR